MGSLLHFGHLILIHQSMLGDSGRTTLDRWAGHYCDWPQGWLSVTHTLSQKFALMFSLLKKWDAMTAIVPQWLNRLNICSSDYFQHEFKITTWLHIELSYHSFVSLLTFIIPLFWNWVYLAFLSAVNQCPSNFSCLKEPIYQILTAGFQ